MNDDFMYWACMKKGLYAEAISYLLSDPDFWYKGWQ